MSAQAETTPYVLKVKLRGREKNTYGALHEPLIYAIRTGPFVKIGWTRSMGQRIRHISDAIPYELEVVGVTPGGKTAEKALHSAFAEHRVKGEWFRIAPQMQLFLSSLRPYVGPVR